MYDWQVPTLPTVAYLLYVTIVAPTLVSSHRKWDIWMSDAKGVFADDRCVLLVREGGCKAPDKINRQIARRQLYFSTMPRYEHLKNGIFG